MTAVLGYGRGGLVMLAVGGLGWLLLGRTLPRAAAVRAVRALAACAGLLALAQLALSAWYLFSPSYFDHVEPTIASIAAYFRRGEPVYPELGSYTFHGLLYGPLLAEATSLGYVLGPSVFGSKVVGWACGWGSAAVVLLLLRRWGGGWPALAAGAGALAVLACFSPVLFWNRADPLLLLCATLALAVVGLAPGAGGAAAASFLGGAAMNLKVHGALYVVPALALWAAADPRRPPRVWRGAGLAALGGGALGALLPLVPANVSIAAYRTYLELAVVHGLSGRLLAYNATMLVGLWTPMLLAMLALRRVAAVPPAVRAPMAALLLAEGVVTIVGSKQGAGAHHLMPFLPFHAWLTHRLLAVRGDSVAPRDAVAAAGAVGLLAVVVGVAWPSALGLRGLYGFDARMSEQRSARAEVEAWADRYRGAVVGVGDMASYPDAAIRPWLTFRGTRQIEFGAFMDLKLSGVDDAPLARALDRCEIPYLVVPRPGRPFTMTSSYDARPLFSDAVRDAFARRFELVESGGRFDVYGCRTG